MRFIFVLSGLLLYGSLHGNCTPGDSYESTVPVFATNHIANFQTADTCIQLIPFSCPQPLELHCGVLDEDQAIAAWIEESLASIRQDTINFYSVELSDFNSGCTDLDGFFEVDFFSYNLCGDTLQCTSQIIIKDETSPTFVRLDSVVTLYCSEADQLSEFVIRDDCDNHIYISFVEESVVSEDCSENLIYRTWEAKDYCGNTSYFTQKIILIDTVPPEALFIPRDTTLTCNDVIHFDNPIFRDDCSSITVQIEDNLIENGCVVIHERSWTAQDACGNERVVTQKISVEDHVSPIFIQLPDDSILFNRDEIPQPEDIVATDNCGEVSLNFQEYFSEDCPLKIHRVWIATDHCGNESRFDQFLVDTSVMTTSFLVDPINCDDHLGSIQVLVNGGKEPFSYIWDTGDTLSQAFTEKGGRHEVTVTDDFGCTKVSSEDIPVGITDFVLETKATGTNCDVDNGVFQIFMSGGSAPFQFAWENGYKSEISSLGGLAGGRHEVTIVDSEGCDSIHVFDIPYLQSCGGSLSGTVWEDLNGDGSMEDSEPGLANIAIGLFVEDQEVDSFVTQRDGLYSFHDLEEGAYYLKIKNIGSYQVSSGLTSLSEHMSDFDPQSLLTDTFIIAEREHYENLDLGLYKYVTIGDQVWLDLDADCVQDENETGVKNVPVQLLNAEEEVIFQTLSDAQGNYNFSNLTPGKYYVSLFVPLEYRACSVIPNSFYIPELSNEMRSVQLELTSGHNFHQLDYGLEPKIICPLNVIPNIRHSSCGLANGAISLSIIGCGPFTFQWSNGSVDRELSDIGAGVYTCIITDDFGFQVIKDFFVQEEESDIFTAAIGFANPSCSEDNGLIHVESFGGVRPYKYVWNTGDSTNIIENLGAGIYEAYITDNVGCDGYFNFELTDSVECPVGEPVGMELGVFLEGPYDDEDKLLKSSLKDLGYLPGQIPSALFGQATEPGQPYDNAPWNYQGNEGLSLTEYPDGFIDWILVSLRSDIHPSTVMCQKAAYLMWDGRIEFEEGLNTCDLDETKEYYVIVEHRNHLMVMSHIPVSIKEGMIAYDFRIQTSYKSLFGNGQKEISPGVFAMFAGNVDQTKSYSSIRDINFNDILAIQSQAGNHSSYLNADINFNGDVNVNDIKITLDNLGRFSDVPK